MFKKILLYFYILLITISLVSCNKYNPVQISESSENPSISVDSLRKLDLPQKANPIFINDNSIIYTIEEKASLNNFSFITYVFYYDIETEETIQIKNTFDGSLSRNPVCINNKLYDSIYLNDNRIGVYEIDISNFTGDIIYIWNEYVMFENFYNANDQLVFNCIIPYDDSLTGYRIGIINTDTGKSFVITETTCNIDTQSGTAICCINTYDGHIFAFTNKENQSKTKTSIVEYDLTGNVIEETPIKVENFCMEKADSNPEIGWDAVTCLKLTDKFFIFESLNGRIAFVSRGNAEYADIPRELHNIMPGFYRIAPINASCKIAVNNVFIINSFADKKNLFVFDSENMNFESYSLLVNPNAYNSYVLSENCDIVLIETLYDEVSGEDINTYYFLPYEQL